MTGWANAQIPLVQLNDTTPTYSIGKQVEYLEDSSGVLTLDAVRASPDFVRSQKSVPSFGFSKAVYWFRCRIRANTPDPDRRWLLELGYSHFRTVDLYLFGSDNQLVEIILAGNSRGNQHRPLATHNYVFPLRLTIGQEATLYFRCDGMASKLFPLTVYEQHAFYEQAQNTSLWLGFYFGFLFITLLYHFFLYLYNQPRSYLLFSAYLLAYLLNELIRGNGNYIERLVLVHYPFWQQHVVALLNGVIVLVSVLGLRFYSVGLLLVSTGWMHRLLIGLSWINLLVYGLLLTGVFPDSWSLLFNFAVPLVSYLSVLIVSLLRLTEGYRSAWYYFVATLILFMGVLVVLAERAGWLLGTNFWQHNAIQVASVIEIILLSLGFAEGIRAERRRRRLDLEIADLTGRKSEREWLSMVLHTSFGTTLSAMLFEFSQLDWKQMYGTNVQRLQRLHVQLGDSLNEVRLLSRSLPPTLLDEQGLSAAFNALTTAFNRRKLVQFRLVIEGEEQRLEPRHEFELYLIGLELLNNVMHHAEATSASLELIWGQQNLVTIQMHDNGKGFNDNQPTDGYGLAGIRRIVEKKLNGAVRAGNVPGGGALVTIQVRLPRLNNRADRISTRTPTQRLFGVVRSYF